MGMWVGRGRKARAAYGFDDIALVPGRADHQPQRSRHLLGALRPSLRHPDHRRRHGRRREPLARHRDGPARRPRRPQPRGHLLPLRESRRRARPHHLRQPRRGDQDHPGHLRRADQGRADPQAHLARSRRAAGPVVVSSIPQRAERFAKIARGGGRRLLRRAVHRDHRAPHRHRVHARSTSGKLKKHLADPAHRRQRRHLRGLPRADGDAASTRC